LESGGKPLFPTFEAACVESFKIADLAGEEGGLAPAAVAKGGTRQNERASMNVSH
jgi:hypothetical protein